MSINLFKLITGEEVVAEVVPGTGTGYYLRNCVALVMQRGPQGLGQSLMPWAHGVEGLVHLTNEHIIYTATPTQDLLDAYNQAFNTNTIAVPNKELIIG